MKYLKLIALLSLLVNITAYANQSTFGIEKGLGAGVEGKAKREEIENKGRKIDKGVYLLSAEDLDYINKDFKSYIITLSESAGVCEIIGISGTYSSNAELFKKVKKQLAEKYGNPASEITASDSTLYIWNTQDHIMLVKAKDSFTLRFRFDNSQACEKELQEAP